MLEGDHGRYLDHVHPHGHPEACERAKKERRCDESHSVDVDAHEHNRDGGRHGKSSEHGAAPRAGRGAEEPYPGDEQHDDYPVDDHESGTVVHDKSVLLEEAEHAPGDGEPADDVEGGKNDGHSSDHGFGRAGSHAE